MTVYKKWKVADFEQGGKWHAIATRKLKLDPPVSGQSAIPVNLESRGKTRAAAIASVKKKIDKDTFFQRNTPAKVAARRAKAKNPSGKGKGFARLLNPDKATSRTKLERAPVSMNGQIGAEIGKVLELQLPDLVVKLGKSKPRLIWFPEVKSLGFFMHSDDRSGGRLGWMNVRASEAKFDELDEMGYDLGPPVEAFKAFMGRGPKYEAKTYSYPDRGTRGWYSINRVLRIDYWSDKFRADREYTHEHGPGVRLYIYGSPRRGGPSFWLIRGGRLTVTERGIIN